MADDDRLTGLLDAFAEILTNDPGPLDPTSPYYVPNLHGTNADDVVQTLARTLRRTQGSGMSYFSGQRGTGKSTELRRLTMLLNGAGNCRALMVDALEYIGESHLIELIDVLLVMTVAFAEKIREETGEEFLQEGVATRFSNWLQTEVEIGGFTVLGVKGEFRKQQQSVTARIRAFDLGRRERFVTDCQEFIRDMAAFVKKRYRVEKVVLILDSLERLQGSRGTDNAMFGCIVQVFDIEMDALRIPETQVIYSIPPYLPYLSNVRSRVGVCTLASVRVYEPPPKRRQLRRSGLDALARVVDKRFPAWRDVITPQALDHLMLASGGDVRQLLRRLLLDTLDQAYYALDRLPLALDDEIIETVVKKHRIEFEQMVVQEEYPLLKTIADGNTVDLPKRSDLPTAARFFDIRAVLNYRNGVDWVDLNPLLWPLIDAYQLPAAHAASAA